MAEFVGRNNILSGTVASLREIYRTYFYGLRQALQVPTNSVQLTEGQNTSFVISADLVHISLEKPASINAVYCKLISEEFVGSMVTLFLEDAGGQEFKVQMQERELSKFDLSGGAEIWLSWEAKSAHVIRER